MLVDYWDCHTERKTNTPPKKEGIPKPAWVKSLQKSTNYLHDVEVTASKQ